VFFQVGIGHNVFQGRNAAFNVKEVIVTAPFYMWMRTLRLFGYKCDFWEEVEKSSKKWDEPSK